MSKKHYQMTTRSFDMNSRPRYAIYFAPNERTPLGRFGCHWLGRSAAELDSHPVDLPENLEQHKHQQLIEAPKHYGFHGTLKAPFELNTAYTSNDLDEALQNFAQKFPSFTIDRLKLQTIASFIALTPEEQSENLSLLQSLHEELTENIDYLRAPLSDYDKNRFMARDLSTKLKENLLNFGYPFVLESFKFHLTLTSSLKKDDISSYFELLDRLTTHFRDDGFFCDRISLFRQETRTSPFLLTNEYMLQGL